MLTLASCMVSVIFTNSFSTNFFPLYRLKQSTSLYSSCRNATLTLLPSLLANNASLSLFSATPLFPLPPAVFICISFYMHVLIGKYKVGKHKVCRTIGCWPRRISMVVLRNERKNLEKVESDVSVCCK